MRILMLGMAFMLTLSTAQAVEPKTTVFDVANMTCPACGLTIEAALRHDAGVVASKVDTKAGTVSVQFDPLKTTTEHVARAITEAGFPAKTHANGR